MLRAKKAGQENFNSMGISLALKALGQIIMRSTSTNTLLDNWNLHFSYHHLEQCAKVKI